MSIEQRTRTAIASVRAKLDQAREDREWANDEAARLAGEDAMEVARHDEVGMPSELDCESPGYKRAVEHVREKLRERDEALEAAEDDGEPDELDALCVTEKPRRRQSGPADDFADDDDGDGSLFG